MSSFYRGPIWGACFDGINERCCMAAQSLGQSLLLCHRRALKQPRAVHALYALANEFSSHSSPNFCSPLLLFFRHPISSITQMYSASCHSFELFGDQVCLKSNSRSLKESPLSQLAELLPATACSLVTTCYIDQVESSRDDLATNTDGNAEFLFHIIRFYFPRHVSPGLALGSCLVLGCCLSSYVHRRRDRDRYQVIVFVVWLVWAICIGWGIGASANRITLGIVPWACCAAMIGSFFGHAGARWISERERCEHETIFASVHEKEIHLGR
ncbi:uncharacterized protein GGS22DRAFT_151687 [Annulohypoxylon maeteangense]|uniref:uncharacterized protein n=1 Tax=Annulohypoxylon maeteangense TaxID=1927788 RepID=UPI002008A7F9|nr:uncharacterized protein GGS22DRAFT_151687 [Annulohypoxylon maeteangense]KAI0890725.1 hypothetical protein GGS22DRAFT_151687 [Annulohypoxylon maeteangense]